ncbi:MAG: VOC family protein [Arenicella sp.]
MQVHYLEVVTPNVEQVCTSYSQTMNVSFSDAVAELGGARTVPLSNGGMLGIRAPMHDAEEPTTRPYYLVDDIEKAVNEAAKTGAKIAVPPMEIPGRGKCAIIMFGFVQSGFWQV